MGFEAEIDNSERNGVVENLRAEIICSICCSIFEDPMRLDCCDGHLCRKCFNDVKKNSGTCALCRSPNVTAKFSRLMVIVLSQFKLFCPAEKCNESVPYANFAKHKETCPILNRKPCSQCNEVYSKEDFQAHFSCFEELNKKVSTLESEVEETRTTIEQLISTNESERRESRNEVKNLEQKVKSLEEKLTKEEAKSRVRNQGGLFQGATIQERSEELEKIKNELGVDGGAGHKSEVYDSRGFFDEEAVRRVLRGLEAGLTEVNFLERDRVAFYFLFFVWTRF